MNEERIFKEFEILSQRFTGFIINKNNENELIITGKISEVPIIIFFPQAYPNDPPIIITSEDVKHRIVSRDGIIKNLDSLKQWNPTFELCLIVNEIKRTFLEEEPIFPNKPSISLEKKNKLTSQKLKRKKKILFTISEGQPKPINPNLLYDDDRLDKFRKICKTYQEIDLKEMAKLLNFTKPMELKQWLLTVVSEYNIKIKRKNVIFPENFRHESEETEKAIDSLLKRFSEHEQSKKGKIDDLPKQ